jgi:hypothetical protein
VAEPAAGAPPAVSTAEHAAAAAWYRAIRRTAFDS